MSTSWDRSSMSRVEVDEVWKSLGRFGRYQIVQILLLVTSGMSLAYPVLSVVFEGTASGHYCQPPKSFLEENRIFDNSSVRRESCRAIAYYNHSGERNISSGCDGYQFERPKHLSFVSEWELVCNKAALTQLSQTVVMAGMFLGAIMLSNLADRFGRKKTSVGCQLCLLGLSLAMAFAPNYVGFIVIKFFVGVFQQGYMIPLNIHFLELIPMEQRAFMGTCGSLIWSLSIMSMSPIAYFMRSYSWRTIQIVFAVMHSVCLVDIFMLDESLRWLVANHRFSHIRQVICRAARYNHRDPDVVFFTALTRTDMLRRTGTEAQAFVSAITLNPITEVDEEEEMAEGSQDTEGKKGGSVTEGGENPEPRETGNNKDEDAVIPRHEGFLDLVRDSDMRFLTLTMLYIWMTNSLTYYGITLLSSSLAGNHYLNFFLGGLIEIPSNLIMWLGLARIGRKKTTILFIVLAGCALLLASILAAFAADSEGAAVAQTVLSLVARFGITGSFNAMWVYTPELFPTNLRNLGVGIASSSARVGGMAAPFFKLLSDIAVWAPGVIFSLSCLLVAFLLTLLPETKHRSLPQTITDVKTWRWEEKKEKQEGQC